MGICIPRGEQIVARGEQSVARGEQSVAVGGRRPDESCARGDGNAGRHARAGGPEPAEGWQRCWRPGASGEGETVEASAARCAASRLLASAAMDCGFRSCGAGEADGRGDAAAGARGARRSLGHPFHCCCTSWNCAEPDACWHGAMERRPAGGPPAGESLLDITARVGHAAVTRPGSAAGCCGGEGP